MKFFNHKKITTINSSRQAGFTLAEMMVAVFVFSVVMVLSTGAIFSIISANKTSQALKSVMDNLSSALDSMSREIRYGTIYNCGGDFGDYSNIPNPASCPSNGEGSFSFINKDGDAVGYRFNSTEASIEKSRKDKSGDVFTDVRLTAEEVHITGMSFYVDGAMTNDLKQPWVRMVISGYAQAGSNTSKFNIETMVSQRSLMCKNAVQGNLDPDHPCP